MTRHQAERINQLVAAGWETEVPEFKEDNKEDIIYGGPIKMVKGDRKILVMPNGAIQDTMMR